MYCLDWNQILVHRGVFMLVRSRLRLGLDLGGKKEKKKKRGFVWVQMLMYVVFCLMLMSTPEKQYY